jgi:hypothetical protein
MWEIIISNLLTATIVGGGIAAYHYYRVKKELEAIAYMKEQAHDAVIISTKIYLYYLSLKGIINLSFWNAIIAEHPLFQTKHIHFPETLWNYMVNNDSLSAMTDMINAFSNLGNPADSENAIPVHNLGNFNFGNFDEETHGKYKGSAFPFTAKLKKKDKKKKAIYLSESESEEDIEVAI